MPHGYSVREATNEHEVYSALTRATAGYGNLVKFARRAGLSPEHVHGMMFGNQRVSVRVARALGWELRWVRVSKGEG
jgi:hypothetical protein